MVFYDCLLTDGFIDRISLFHYVIDWEQILQDIAEVEKREIKLINGNCEPEQLYLLPLELGDMKGRVHIFASQEIFDLFVDIEKLLESFLVNADNPVQRQPIYTWNPGETER